MTQLFRPSIWLNGFITITVIFLTNTAFGQSETPELKTEQEKLLYFMGTQMGESLMPLRLSEEEFQLVMRGTNDVMQGDAIELDPRVYGPQLTRLSEERRNALLKQERPKAKAYLTRMAVEDGAQTMESGLIFLPLKTGTGAIPASDSLIELNFRGTLRDGAIFDSSVDRGQPIQIPLDKVIPCWQEGFSMIKEGGTAKLTCPAKLAYQDRGIGNVPPGAAITFEVELIRIVK